MRTEYAKRVFEEFVHRNANQLEYQQAVREVLESLEMVTEKKPVYEEYAILERLVEPERLIIFRVPWIDDNGKIQVNRGFRVQFNSAIGPYKGGLRFHPSVNASIIKFLGFEQVLKNSLTGLPMGGGKGGADFDPKGKSENEVKRFCQSFMTELCKHIGQFTDVPAGDIGVGNREIGYMYGQYKRIRNEFVGVLTGKGLSYGGSLVRTEATGYGLCYYAEKAMRTLQNDTFEGKTVAVSGSGNVALFATEKVHELGGKVITLSDSAGWVLDPKGIDLELAKEIKLGRRGRIRDYAKERGCEYHEGKGLWEVPCDIALPGATQNEVEKADAEALVKNGCKLLAEGSNMSCTPEAIDVLQTGGVIYGPGKAANAGGVATSGLEMAQNSMRLLWSFEEVDQRLKGIMENIVDVSLDAAKRYGMEGDLMAGANIAGFEKVADAMFAEGAV